MKQKISKNVALAIFGGFLECAVVMFVILFLGGSTTVAILLSLGIGLLSASIIYSARQKKDAVTPNKAITAKISKQTKARREKTDYLENTPATAMFYVGKTTRPPRGKLCSFDIVGESYSRENFLRIGELNPDWDLSRKELLSRFSVGDCIFQYRFDGLPAQIIRERDNPTDINALRVDISGLKVGYIARKDQKRIAPFLRQDYLLWRADVLWGPLKEIYEREDGVICYRTKNNSVYLL